MRIYARLLYLYIFRNASRTSEMAELLTTLRKLQTRFAPFLDRYHKFMQEDPVVPPEVYTHT